MIESDDEACGKNEETPLGNIFETNLEIKRPRILKPVCLIFSHNELIVD